MKPIVLAVRLGFAALFILFMVLGKPMLWLLLFAVGLVLTPWLGRVYCGWACPMNTVMTPISMIMKKTGRKQKDAPGWLKNGVVAWASLILSVMLTIAGRQILKRNIPVLLIWLAIAVIMTFFYQTSVFHKWLCPFGAPLKIAGRFARMSRHVDAAACKAHGNCVRACPSAAIAIHAMDGVAAIDPSICHQCLNCSSVCPEHAIHYEKRS